MSTGDGSRAHESVETIFRIEYARIIAGVTHIVRDVGIAEELAQDALVTALETWPQSGVPDNPGAWLMATAKHRAIDLVRRRESLRPQAGRSRTVRRGCATARASRSRCHRRRHPAVDLHGLPSRADARGPGRPNAEIGRRAPNEEIARAFLTSESTVAQRIVRAKRTLATAQVPFEIPYGDERSARVSSVLEVIYLIFNEGYSATAGDDLTRPGLCEDALRLARQLSALMPAEPEAHGLEALLEFQASRIAARTGPEGEPVLLADQNRSRWNRMLIERGIRALELAGDGPYSIQAAIAGCHATAIRYVDTDWTTIAQLYLRLAKLTPSPVVELNRAVALSMSESPEMGLKLVDSLATEPSLKDYHLLPSVRGDLLQRLGRTEEARAEFEKAASMTRNTRERDLLLGRAASLAGSSRGLLGPASPLSQLE